MIILPSHKRIQRRVGITLFSGGMLIACYNLLRLVEYNKPFFLSDVNVINAILIAIISCLVLLISLIDSPVIRLIQVLLFGAGGLIGIFINDIPYNMDSLVWIVVSIILAIQYSFFEKRFILKIAICVTITIIMGMIGSLIRSGFDILSVLAGLTVMVMFIMILWIAFHEVLTDHINKARELELRHQKNSIFIRFGKNVAGLVHNIRNMLTMLVGIESIAGHVKDAEKLEELTERKQYVFTRMSDAISRILNVVKARQDSSLRIVDLNELVTGIIDFFRTDLDFKNNVRTELDLYSKNLTVEAQPLELCEIIENLVKNSWEAMAEKQDNTENIIKIKTFKNGAPRLSITDNGSGIAGLTECRNKECSKFFKIGQTSKEQGTGLGVPFVLEAVKSNGWDITFKSQAKKGTMVTLLFTANKK